jgi:hypothetical protein
VGWGKRYTSRPTHYFTVNALNALQCIYINFFGVAGGPLNRGAPCHGIIGILVNPALIKHGVSKCVIFSRKWAKTHLYEHLQFKKIFRLAIARHSGRGRKREKTGWEWDKRGERREGRDRAGEAKGRDTPRFSNRFTPWF